MYTLNSQVIDLKSVFELKRELQVFLTERPSLQPLQQKINDVLSRAGKDPINRNVVIQNMMMESFSDLISALKELSVNMNKTLK